jgi:alanine dehydrogenase
MVGMAEQGALRRGNGVVGVLEEQTSKWERRAPLSPHHCAKLLKSGVKRILVQPCSKRIYRDGIYKDSGCEISEDLSECGLILGVKQPKVGQFAALILCPKLRSWTVAGICCFFFLLFFLLDVLGVRL